MIVGLISGKDTRRAFERNGKKKIVEDQKRLYSKKIDSSSDDKPTHTILEGDNLLLQFL